MKKLFASILAITTVTVLFASAPVDSYSAAAYSVDWYMIDGNLITSQGDVDQLVTNNKPVYVKDADDKDNDKVLFFGWVQLEEQKEISAIGYKIDDGEAVYDDNFFSRLTSIAACRIDRTEELKKANLPNAEGFVIEFGYAELSEGDHTASFMVKGDDDVDCAFFTYGFSVAPDTAPQPAVIINTWIDSNSSEEDIAETHIIETTGWTGANYEILDIGYGIDGEEPVFGDGSVVLIPVSEDDPVKSTGIGGGRYAERFSAHIDLDGLDLSDGAHTLAIYVKVADENETVLKIYKVGDGKPQGAIVFLYGDFEDHENDVRFCEKADTYDIGWWMHPENMPEYTVYDICVAYTTGYAFDGFTMACFAGVGADTAELKAELLDEDEVLLESHNITVAGNHNTKTRGFIKVNFDKTYAKGSYVIHIVFNNGRYFVLASGDHNYMRNSVEVYGNNYAQIQDDANGLKTARSPAIKLIGAEEQQSEEDNSDEGSSDTPPTDESESEEDSGDSGSEQEPDSGDGSEEETDQPPITVSKDVNGDGEANNKDVVYLFRLVSRNAEYDETCDIDGDGENNNKDVVALFRALSKLEYEEKETDGTTAEPEEIIYADESDETSEYLIEGKY